MIEEFLRVPKDRVAVLIGINGKTKRLIEKKTKTRIEIDSGNGEVSIKGKTSQNVYKALDIARAVARGFSPERALKLLEGENYLEIIDLSEFVGKSEKAISQRKSRIIGREGRARREIELMTNTEISAYGKTVAIIGSIEDVQNARKAVEMLVKGASHTTAFDSLRGRGRREGFEP